MKKIFFIALLSFFCITTQVQAEKEGFGNVGVDKIQATTTSPTSIKINTTFFNLSNVDIPVQVEVSVTDVYSEKTFRNTVKLTSDVLDSNLLIPKRVNSYAKEYVYNIPNILKKNSYRIELRVLDGHENTLYEKQSDVLTLGDVSASNIAGVETKSWFQYDGKKYKLQDGPIIAEKKKDTAFYEIEINNTGTTSLKVFADYSTRKYALQTSIFTKNTDASVSVEVPRKSKKIIQIPAKYIAEGGTYEGKIDLSVQYGDKTIVLKTEEFRYMIGSSFVVVTSAQLGTSTAVLRVAKTLFDSTIELTEAYLNSTSSHQIIEDFKNKEYAFDVDFLNDTNVSIGTQSSKIAWGNINPTVQVPTGLTDVQKKDVAHIRVTVKDFSGLTLFTGVFDIIQPTVHQASKTLMPLTRKTVAMVTLYTLIVLALIGYGVNRHKLWILCVLVCASLLGYVHYSQVFATGAINSGNFSMSAFADGGIDAGSNSQCWNHGYRGLTMSPVTYPAPSDTFVCGQTVQVRLDPTNQTCGNTSSYTYFYVSGLNGLTVSNGAGGTVPVGSGVLVYNRDVGPYPLTITFNEGFTGNATLTGHYYNINGACASTAGDTTFTFSNVTCPALVCTCSYDGTSRNQTCTRNTTVISTTKNSPACALGASCYQVPSASSSVARFNVAVTNAIDSRYIRYWDVTDTSYHPPLKLPAYIERTATGSATPLKVKVTDVVDASTVYASCTSTSPYSNTGGGNGNSTTTPAAKILNFTARNPVVSKGTQCEYNWSVENIDSCTVTINNQAATVVAPGLSGPLFTETVNGLNQKAQITCVRNATGTSPMQTVSTTTLCQVLPEVIEH